MAPCLAGRVRLSPRPARERRIIRRALPGSEPAVPLLVHDGRQRLSLQRRDSIFSIARWANRRTSPLGSESALRNAGSASFAAGPIPVNPIHALFREPSSESANSVISAGTALAAFG